MAAQTCSRRGGSGGTADGCSQGQRWEARRGGDLQGRQFCEYPENLEVTFRSICTRGCWASLPALGGGSNTPQAEIRAPGQAPPPLCPGQPGEGCHPAEDRRWSFVLISGSGALRYLQALARGTGGMRPSHDHLGCDAEEEVVVPPPHLQQERRLGQHGLLQLTRVRQRTPVDLDDDVTILDAASLRRRIRRNLLHVNSTADLWEIWVAGLQLIHQADVLLKRNMVAMAG